MTDDFSPIVRRAARGHGAQVRRALVVGIDAYEDEKWRTVAASDGAKQLASVLAAGGYHVTALCDRDGTSPATLAAVKGAMREMMKASDENDIVLFYFAGHGDLLKGRPVLFMADVRRRGRRYVEGALPVSTLLSALRGRPRWTTVLLDACHVGLALDPSCSRSTRASSERAGGFALLSGSTSLDVTQDDSSGPTSSGAFTKAVISGLSGAAADRDGGVRFSALARHVQGWLEKWRHSAEGQVKGATQTPVLRLEVADVQILPAPKYRDLRPGHAAKITCAAFTPDGRRLLTGSEDGTARFWDPTTGAQIRSPISHDGDVAGLAFAPRGDAAVCVSAAGLIHILDASSGRVIRSARAGVRGTVNGVAEADDGTSRAIATSEGLFVEDVHGVFAPKGLRRLQRKRTWMWSVAFTTGLLELVTGDDEGHVTLWSALAGAPEVIGTHEGPVWVVATGPDDTLVAAGGTDLIPGPTLNNQPRIWSTETRKMTLLPGHVRAVTAMAFSPNGKHVATASYDGLVRVFDLGGALQRVLARAAPGEASSPEAYAVRYSPDGTKLFAGYSDGAGGCSRCKLEVVVTTEQKPTISPGDSTRRMQLHLVYCERVLVPPRVFGPVRGALAIGREVSGGIALGEDRRASRHHATIHASPSGTLRIIDERSRNGTQVNGVNVADRVLAEGDVITVGDSLLVVRAVGADVADAEIRALVGWGPAMRAVRAAIAQIAPSGMSVLVQAETGCGKELAARALHERSRRGGPFVPVNCAALPESLAASQLFGQLAGSFTGGVARPGYFRAAEGGTLFLDELGEMPPAIQPMLLRALQDRAVVPLGGTAAVACDVRIVAATNRNLREDVDAGRFRADLYARIVEASVVIPPLRDRIEDALGLLVHALGSPRLSSPLAEALLLHRFPLNVRELQAMAKQLQLRGREPYERATIEELLTPASAPSTPAEEPEDDRGPPSREELEALLRTHRGVVADIARAMQRSRKQVYRWLAHHALDAAKFR